MSYLKQWTPIMARLAAALALASIAVPIAAQDEASEPAERITLELDDETPPQSSPLRTGLNRETSLLDERIDAYADRREIERRALDELMTLNQLLDQTIVDPNAQPQELIDLETEITQARDQACGTSLESGGARQAMYDQMLRLQALIDTWERRSIDLLEAGNELSGTWRISGEDRANGLLSLAQDGTRLSGTFRLSNGSRGSVTGTVADGELQMRLVESTSRALIDVKAALEKPAEFPFDNDNPPEMTGRWQTLELADGRPSGGEWTATWLSIEKVLEQEP